MLNNNYLVGLYIRLSREDEDKTHESESISNQKSLLLQYTKENNLKVYDMYIDDGYSGTNFNRPNFNRLIKDIELGKINMVITKDMSRLGRDYIGTGNLIEKYFPEHNVRYIAITDNIDTFLDSSNNDIAPFKAIMNDMYAKDISKKIKSSLKSKQKEGKWVGSKTPFGYIKDPNNKDKWLVDEPAAEVVRKIYNLCIQGYGTTQIARKLKEDGIMTPTEYYQSLGRKSPTKVQEVKNFWNADTVNNILDRQEYIGDTVNFKCTTRSYKDKTRVKLPKEDRKVFKNTHEPIIDEYTWNIAKQLRNNRKKPTRSGKKSIFSGLLFCNDCGKKMYFQSPVKDLKNKDHYRCSSYKHDTSLCTSHYISDEILQVIVLENIQRVISYVKSYEDLFIQEQLAKSTQDELKHISKNKKELEKAKNRVIEIDNLFMHIYEDNISGKLTDERFRNLSFNYDKEQQELKIKIEQLSKDIENTEKKDTDITQFISNVKKYTEISELTPEILNELIEKIIIHQAEKIDGKKVQEIDIYYRGVGIISFPVSLEDMTMVIEKMLNKKISA